MLLQAGRHNMVRRGSSAHMLIVDRHEPDEGQLAPTIGHGDGPDGQPDAKYRDEAGRCKDSLADNGHDTLHPSRDDDILAQAWASLDDGAGSNRPRDNNTRLERCCCWCLRVEGFVHCEKIET